MSQAGINNIGGGGGGGSPVETLTGNSGGAVSPTANNINVIGDGVTTNVIGTPGTSTLTISVINEGIQWIDEAISFNAASGKGYFCTADLICTLPVGAQGNVIYIYVDYTPSGEGTFKVQTQANQQILIGSNESSVGGYATTIQEGSILQLVFRLADLTWHEVSTQGSWQLF